MDIKPCFLIPIYNHKDTIEATIEALAPHGFPCYIVDDGSDEATKIILKRLADAQPLVKLHQLKENRGKGAAVIEGFALAADAHTHAFQIDADSQHDLSEVGHFLEMAKKNPHSLICGYPIYDQSVPKGRRYARYLTHFWVGVETLCLRPPDAMCGFRVYPIAESLKICHSANIGTRMEFDIEILVRLVWDKVAVISLPVRVSYPEGGLSNFRYAEDNLRISYLHARLTTLMLLSFPIAICRKCVAIGPPTKNGAGNHWSDLQERGSLAGIRFLLWTYKTLGRFAFEVMLYPVVFYFYLSSPKQRRASRKYLERVIAEQGQRPPRAPAFKTASSFRHYLEFSRSILDRVSAWTGDLKREDVCFDDSARSQFIAAARSKRGGVILGAHLGSMDLCRPLIDPAEQIKLNILVYTNHAAKFNAFLAQLNPAIALNLISVDSVGPETALLLKDKIERGEFVVILADRPSAQARNRVVQAEFLGKPAAFPEGPFVLAHLLACPVFLLFCIKQEGSYKIFFEKFAERMDLPRDGRKAFLQQQVRRFARRLEHYCLCSPYQWFNFFDFWKSDTDFKELSECGSQNNE